MRRDRRPVVLSVFFALLTQATGANDPYTTTEQGVLPGSGSVDFTNSFDFNNKFAFYRVEADRDVRWQVCYASLTGGQLNGASTCWDERSGTGNLLLYHDMCGAALTSCVLRIRFTGSSGDSYKYHAHSGVLAPDLEMDKPWEHSFSTDRLWHYTVGVWMTGNTKMTMLLESSGFLATTIYSSSDIDNYRDIVLSATNSRSSSPQDAYIGSVRLRNTRTRAALVLFKVAMARGPTSANMKLTLVDQNSSINEGFEIPSHIYTIIWGFLLGCTAVVVLLHIRECVIRCLRRRRSIRQRQENNRLVLNLPQRNFNEDEWSRSEGDKECVICLETYEKNEEIRILPCGHHFHLKCADTWLLENHTCPLCKQGIGDAQDFHSRRNSMVEMAPLENGLEAQSLSNSQDEGVVPRQPVQCIEIHTERSLEGLTAAVRGASASPMAIYPVDDVPPPPGSPPRSPRASGRARISRI